MKVHLQKKAQVTAGYELQATQSWAKDGLISCFVKMCDSLMMSVGQEHRFTSDSNLVTCKHCLKKM